MVTRRSGRDADGLTSSSSAGQIEDRGVGADGHSDRQRRRREEERLLRERAQRVAQILDQVLDQGDPPRVAALLADRDRPDRSPQRGGPRLVRGSCPVRDVLVDLFLEVLLEFVLQLAVGLLLRAAASARAARSRSIHRRMRSSSGSVRFANDQPDRVRQAVPAFELAGELFASRRRERVELGRRGRWR